jgi:hypothetical protein
MLRRVEIGLPVVCTSGVAAFDPGSAIDNDATASGPGAGLRFSARVGGRLELDHPGLTVGLTRRRVVEC